MKRLFFLFLLFLLCFCKGTVLAASYDDAGCKSAGSGSGFCTTGGAIECPFPYESLGTCTDTTSGQKRFCCKPPQKMNDLTCKEKGKGVGFCSPSKGSCSTSSGEVTLGECTDDRKCCAPANGDCSAKDGTCKEKSDTPPCETVEGVSCEKSTQQCCKNTASDPSQLSDSQCSGKGSGAKCVPGSSCAIPTPKKYGDCTNSRSCCAPEDSAPLSPPVDSTASFSYNSLETLPGGGSSTDLPSYLTGLYTFGLGAVGIAALLMAIVGGYFYVTSAGNTSRVSKGKELITDAILGIVVAFCAWLMLYIINPDLVNINLGSLLNLETPQGELFKEQSGHVNNSGNGSGGCGEVSSGSCSKDSLKNTCLGSNAEAFSRLCNRESAGKININSGSDICVNYGNRSFSGGLFQINVFANGKLLNDPRCNNLGSKGTCVKGNNPCTGWNCQINNLSDFDYCMGLTHTAEGNIKMACSLSGNGTNTTPWACSANRCGLGGTKSNFCK